MVKPNGYDEAQTMGRQKEEIALGGHHLIIKQVNETVSSTNKPMIVVLFDFDQTDKQAGLLMKEFKDDDRADKKWPHRGTQYIMVNDYQDPSKTSRSYKTFCTCFEQSNGVKINWVEDSAAWAAQFKNKKIGGAFGVVHSVYQGKEIERTELRWFISDDKVSTCQVPMDKLLNENQKKQLTTSDTQETDNNGFINIPEGVDEQLPFN
jgi:hypothetical protein